MKTMKKALITGCSGQDGSHLADFLLKKGYEVHGIIRRVAIQDQNNRLSRILHLLDNPKFHLHYGSLESYSSLIDIITKVQPDELYHLAAQSFVAQSFEDGFSTFETNIKGTYHVLSAVHNRAPKCKVYFAASSEMFGKVEETPQTEITRFHPRSPYGISKVAGYELVRNYRESYGMFACSGILYNHEGERRGKEFVSRKITATIADIKKGKTNVLVLGNIDACRDWGHAADYVEAMWRMLQQKKPDDYIIATGETHSVKEFVDLSFKHIGYQYKIIDLHKLSEEEADKRVEELKNKPGIYVIKHPKYYRPAEVDLLLGDYSKAKRILKWSPRIKFKELVDRMIESDLRHE
jgi:GDPmannose 4,6-dehydratase